MNEQWYLQFGETYAPPLAPEPLHVADPRFLPPGHHCSEAIGAQRTFHVRRGIALTKYRGNCCVALDLSAA